MPLSESSFPDGSIRWTADQPVAKATPAGCNYRRSGELVVYSLVSNDEQALALTAEVCHAAFSPDGRHLAVVDGTTLTITNLSRDLTSAATIPVAGPGPLVWTSHNSLYLAQPSNGFVISLGSDVVTEAIDKLEAPKNVGFAVDQAVVIDRNRFVTVNDSSYVNSIGDSEPNAFEIVDAAISPNGRIALIVESNGTVRAAAF